MDGWMDITRCRAISSVISSITPALLFVDLFSTCTVRPLSLLPVGILLVDHLVLAYHITVIVRTYCGGIDELIN